ncbi:hypothetical protein A11A3_01722 [Alcanivorax hongdengensis A-11-3]|uniref:Uncharacterized protein n=1 Tax=Alcanivorax hongdengensis A-11-3 TaxID=1177179 RepID=L0WEV4_9GAMM|nr:DUF1295 domain-containing protein [Alcanivorax hongdengensis]EKF75551.1 hypothetical protein A11A3_01722 [Alcanivorax hongdengensis A-11-3]
MPDMLSVLLAQTALATLLWLYQWRSGNAGWVDVFWSAAVGVTALVYLASGDGALPVRVISALLVTIWSWRLASHIFKRVASDQAEDGRYAAMRASLGAMVQPVFLLFFWAQALLAWLFSLPFRVLADHTTFSWPLLIAGLLVGLLAIAGESLADRQLAAFKARRDSAGKTCREGLWRYSRHPNYFFEWLHWFSYPLIAVGAAGGAWLWLLPVVMWLFLWFVTGIPYTEKQALKSRGDDYRHYQQTTSAFFPWRPKS